jgi:outer membrane protein assembly factor BamB/tetratricopeptide (TPR) repeat protein
MAQLLGRQAEINTIDEAIDAALNGERRLVVIVGDAASGRSQLLEAAASDAADRGATVASAQGHEAEVSEIGRVAEGLGLADDGDVATVLVIDDAQWADPTSIGLLQRTLATNRAGVAIVLGHEPTAGVKGLALDRLEDAATRFGRVEELVLAPLTSAELAAVSDPAIAEALTTLTGGTYAAVDRLVSDWVDDGVLTWNNGRLEASSDLPETWEGGTGVRPEELEPPARKLVEAVSLAGRPIPLDVAADLVGVSTDEALAVGEQLVDQGLLVQSREGFAAPSAVDASRIATSLGAVRGGHLYAELARAFSDAGYAERSPGLIGGYYLKAGDPQAAIPLLDEALTAAIAAGGAAEAVPIIDAALSAIEEEGVGSTELEGRLRLERAKYYQTAGWTDLAAEDFQTASRYLEGAARVDALGFLAAVEDNRQDSQTAEVYAAAAIGEATAIDEPLKAGSLLLLQARILNRIGFPAETDASLAKGSAILETDGNPFQRFLAAQNTGRIALDRGKAVEAEPTFERVFTRAEEVAGLAAEADAAAWLARAQFLHGHPSQGLQSVATAMELAEATATGGPIFLGHMAHSEGAGRFAAYEEALDAADSMLGYVLQQLPDWENAARYLRAKALLGLGRVAEAAAEVEAALELTPEGINGWRWRLRIEAFRFSVLAAQGAEWPQARAEDLTDELLQGQWLDVATELMAVRAGIEEDQDLARQAAALALQLGIATTAAAAIEAGGLWSDPAGAAVASRVKETARHVPETWQEAWAAQAGIAAALAAPEVVDEELAAAAAALQSDLDAAMLAAGLADPETALSPAQRREQGLVRRQPGRARRGALLVGAAAAVVILAVGGGFLAATVFAPEEPEVVVQPTVPVTTTIPGIEATKIAEQPRFFANDWVTWGGNQSRNGSTDATGVIKPAGYYWRNDSSQSEFFASPIVLGQQVVIGGLDGQVYFFERRNGEDIVQVRRTQDAVRMTAAGAHITVEQQDTFLAFVPSTDGFLYAFNANNAAELWRHPIEVSGTPAVDGAAGVLYVGDVDGVLYALNAGQTVDELWRLPAEGSEGFGGPITTSITLAGRDLYFGVGDQLWQVNVDTQVATACDVLLIGEALTPVVSDGMIYVATKQGWLHEVDAATCKWSGLNIQVDDTLSAKPAVANGMIYQPGRFGVTAYSLADPTVPAWNGPKRGEGELFAPFVQGSPVVAGGLVYFGSSDQFVYALDAQTGAIVWDWHEDAAITSEVAVTEGVVYVATSEGNVIAIAPDPEAQGNAPTPTTTIPEDTGDSTDPADENSPPTTSRRGGGGGGTM